MTRVVLSTRAHADLTAIGRFIAADNPPRAATFVAELREAAAGLADMPHAFPLVPRYERDGIRRRSWKPLFRAPRPDLRASHTGAGTGP